MNLQSAKIRNLQKHGSVLLFILILLFSFVLLNMAAGLMFADSKLDLTKDKRYTFSPETVQILENLTQPINIFIKNIPSMPNMSSLCCGRSTVIATSRTTK